MRTTIEWLRARGPRPFKFNLAIEIDITHSSLDKLPIYAQLGVPEVWQIIESGDVRIQRLGSDGRYAVVEESVALAGLTGAIASRFTKMLPPVGELLHSEIAQQFEDWIRSQPSAG